MNPQFRNTVLGLLLSVPIFAFGASARKTKPHENAAQAELTRLIQKADQARNTGDAQSVIQANRSLSATVLRLLGQLQLQAGDYAQAAETYQTALQYENTADTQVDDAIALWMNKQFDAAMAQASAALTTDPNNLRAAIVLGRVGMDKQQYAQAATAFARAAALSPGDVELPYSEAIALLDTQKPEDKKRAQAVFAHMRQAYGDTGSLHILFGRAYRDANYMPDAIQEFERAIALQPSTPHAHYFLGLARLSMNEWKPTPQASSEFQQELHYYPNDYLANYMLGYLESSQRNYAEADRYLRKAAALNSSWPEPWLYLGLDEYAEGNMTASAKMMRKAIQATGNDEARNHYQIRRAYIDLGRILAKDGKQAEAQIYLKKARDLQNQVVAQSQQDVAAVVQQEGGKSSAAVVPLNAKQEADAAPDMQSSSALTASLGPSRLEKKGLAPSALQAIQDKEKSLRLILAQSLSDLATAEAMQGKYAQALPVYQQAALWDDKVPGLAKNFGLCAYKNGSYSIAVKWLEQYQQENPSAGNAVRAMLGMAYYGMDQYAKAVLAFLPLGDAGMQDATVGYIWADALTKMGDLKNAADVLQQYQAEMRPNDTLLLVGREWIAIGDYKKAVATFHQILARDPSYPKASFDAGEADMHWEHWEDAAKEFQEELNRTPDDPDALYDLGYVDMQLSKKAEAMTLFQQVLSKHPDYGNAQYQVGKLLLEQNKLQDAVPHLESAARLMPDKDYVHYQLQSAYRKLGRLKDANRELAIYSKLKANSRPHIATAMGSAQ